MYVHVCTCVFVLQRSFTQAKRSCCADEAHQFRQLQLAEPKHWTQSWIKQSHVLLLLQLSQDACRPGRHANMPFYAPPDGPTATGPQQTAVTKLTVALLLRQHG